MHVDFADWYRICTTGTETNLTADLLTHRWAGVEKLADDPNGLEIVRIALGQIHSDEEYIGKFRAAFKEADPTFRWCPFSIACPWQVL